MNRPKICKLITIPMNMRLIVNTVAGDLHTAVQTTQKRSKLKTNKQHILGVEPRSTRTLVILGLHLDSVQKWWHSGRLRSSRLHEDLRRSKGEPAHVCSANECEPLTQSVVRTPPR